MRSPRRKAPSVPASLQRSASASNRRFSLPENWRRLAIATTSGSRRAAASEAVSPVALRAPSATASEEEEPNDPFIEDFSNEVMCMSYLYSKLPETGVSPHIGTGGGRAIRPADSIGVLGRKWTAALALRCRPCPWEAHPCVFRPRGHSSPVRHSGGLLARPPQT